MEMANEKLSNLVQQQACDRSQPVHPLSMMLSGIVDPAVMGGFSNYEKVWNFSRILKWSFFSRVRLFGYYKLKLLLELEVKVAKLCIFVIHF